MLVCRRAHRSHAADAFLAVAQERTKPESRKVELGKRVIGQLAD
jgi:hypothetical protein